MSTRSTQPDGKRSKFDRRMTCVRDIDYEREKLEYKVDGFLRASGWEHTSSTPGCLWLWQRTLPDGRTALCDKSTALAVQRSLDADDDEEWCVE